MTDPFLGTCHGKEKELGPCWDDSSSPSQDHFWVNPQIMEPWGLHVPSPRQGILGEKAPFPAP